MKSNLLRSCVLCLITLSGAVQADSKDITTEAYVNSIYSAVRKTWPVLEQVWDTHVYRQLRLIVADDQNAWAIDSKSLMKIPYKELQHHHLPGEFTDYKEIKWPDGRPTIYFSLGKTLPLEEKARFRTENNPVPSVFSLATHEAFHFFVQTDAWKKTASGNDSRSSPFPVQAAPIIYRNSIIRSLYAALQGDKNGLGHARYWSDQWKKFYPEDANRIRENDILEGSARYIEVAAEIIAKGHSFNSAEFRKAVINEMAKAAEGVFNSSDSQSYPIGALAGFLLNMKNVKWQSDVVLGVPPLDILLRRVMPITQQADNKLENEVNKVVNKINNELGVPIDTFSKAYRSPYVTKIFVDSAWAGSYGVSGGFFRTKDIPHDLLVGVSSSANWAGGSFSVKEAVAMSIDKSAEYKGKQGFVLLYAGKLPPNKNGRLVLKTEKLSLDIKYPEDVEKTHIIYLP